MFFFLLSKLHFLSFFVVASCTGGGSLALIAHAVERECSTSCRVELLLLPKQAHHLHIKFDVVYEHLDYIILVVADVDTILNGHKQLCGSTRRRNI